jgi:hypothetical protein
MIQFTVKSVRRFRPPNYYQKILSKKEGLQSVATKQVCEIGIRRKGFQRFPY